MHYIVTPEQVRQYLTLNSPGSTSKYSDDTIHSNIDAAQSHLERECHRFFTDHPDITWATTTMLQAEVPIPGFREITDITWGGSTMSLGLPGNGNDSPSVWGLWEPSEGIPDGQRLIMALQFRPWRVDNDRPWYYADPLWWDKGLDSPFYPGNYGGGYAYTSMPNDLVIRGTGGYAPGEEPAALKHVVKVLSAWYTMRPASILAQVSVSPGGAQFDYGELPPEVYQFVARWKLGKQAVSVG